MIDVKAIEKAYVLERLSEKQIAEKYRISSNAVRRSLDSLKVLRRTRSEAGRCAYITRHGKKEFVLRQHLTHQDEHLKIAATMLYWGEGAKNGGVVSFSNSNPEMIRIFMRFMRRICGVDEKRLRVTLHYYEDHDPQKLMQFWSKVTSIPLEQFHTPFLHKRKLTGTYRNPSRYGTVLVRYGDVKLLETIRSWIRSYTSSLGEEKDDV